MPKTSHSRKKKAKKFRLLLDSAFAQPQVFPRLAKKCNLAHAVHTFNLSPQALDEEIYQRAIQDHRFVLTINYKDFKKLVKPGQPGIFAIASELFNQRIDQIVSDFLANKDPNDFLGKAVRIKS